MPVHLAPTKRRRISRRRWNGPRSRRSLRIWLVLILATASIVGHRGDGAAVGPLVVGRGQHALCSSDGNGGCQIVLPCPVGPEHQLPDGRRLPEHQRERRPVRLRVGHGLRPDRQHPGGPVHGHRLDRRIPQCLNGNWESQALQPTAVPVTANPATDNLTSLSYPVFSDPAGQGNNPIPSYRPDQQDRAGSGLLLRQHRQPV